MTSKLSGDDERIKELLTGSADEVATGLFEADRTYRYKICGLLRSRFPGMPAEDLPEIWQDVLLSLYRMARERKLNHGGQVGGLIWTLAYRRGQDRMRRNASWQLPIDSMIQELREPVLLEKWHALKAVERSEIVELINKSIERLPPRQQMVWRTYISHYPDAERLKYLTEQVRQTAAGTSSKASPVDDGKPLTQKAVASALQAGRLKIREALRTGGYIL